MSGGTPPTSYALGTHEAARQRLERLAAVFNPHSARWVRQFCAPAGATVVDLGCGPGATTEMLRRVTRCSDVIGLDCASKFLDYALRHFPGCRFVSHDVTQMPLPLAAPAGLIFGRFLLSHLADPVELIDRWAHQLAPGGLLLIEELERIETSATVFGDYLAIMEGMVKASGGRLFVGAQLAAGEYRAAMITNESYTLPLDDAVAASLFLPNVESTWDGNEYVRALVPARRRKAMAQDMRSIIGASANSSSISWTLRRLALRRGDGR